MDIPGNGCFKFEMCGNLTGAGSRVAASFSENLTENIVRISAKCMELLDYRVHPLAVRERSMYSALAVAADKITPAHLSEVPMERIGKLLPKNTPKSRTKTREDIKKIAGRVDLYCRWRHVDFVVEV
jgi:hypothetical protein